MKLKTLLAATVLLATTAAFAQLAPGKVGLSLIVAYPAGGPADTNARMIQAPLQQALGELVLVENVPGAGGALGAQRVLNGNADGHAALVATIGETMLTPLALASAKYKGDDFRLVTPLSRSQFVLVARPNFPAKTLNELLALGNGPKGKDLTYASLGQGSIYHLAMEAFKAQTGVSAVHVPYKGGAQIVTDLAGDHVDLAFLPLAGNTVGMLEQGKLIGIAVTGIARSPVAKGIPTFQESNARMKGFDFSIWPGVFVPKNTSERVVQRLHDALAPILRTPEFVKFTHDSGAATIEPMSLSQAGAMYQAEMDRYNAIARSIKLAPQ